MGDRANVCIKDGSEEVYLYTHWSGCELPAILRKAIRRRARWDDAQYLSRIVFCEMVRDAYDEETGFGISSTVGDGANRILDVDVDNATISERGEKRTWSFEEFANLDDAALAGFWS
jgi:hypothetical protein